MVVRRKRTNGSTKAQFAKESDLYAPIKAHLEQLGYVVKAEVKGCDLVGRRESEPPLIVEMKLTFNLRLLLQGVDRLSLSDSVYLAVATVPDDWKLVLKLCRRVGLGFIQVGKNRVDVLLEPLPYKPRQNKRRISQLLNEYTRRKGDPNVGGVRGIKLMTAYRQQALRCANLLLHQGAMTLRAMRAADDVPDAASILQRDYYGWFQRVGRATYELSPRGRKEFQNSSATADLTNPASTS